MDPFPQNMFAGSRPKTLTSSGNIANGGQVPLSDAEMVMAQQHRLSPYGLTPENYSQRRFGRNPTEDVRNIAQPPANTNELSEPYIHHAIFPYNAPSAIHYTLPENDTTQPYPQNFSRNWPPSDVTNHSLQFTSDNKMADGLQNNMFNYTSRPDLLTLGEVRSNVPQTGNENKIIEPFSHKMFSYGSNPRPDLYFTPGAVTNPRQVIPNEANKNWLSLDTASYSSQYQPNEAASSHNVKAKKRLLEPLDNSKALCMMPDAQLPPGTIDNRQQYQATQNWPLPGAMKNGSNVQAAQKKTRAKGGGRKKKVKGAQGEMGELFPHSIFSIVDKEKQGKKRSPSMTNKQYFCDMCSYQAKNFRDLRKHCISTHNTSDTYGCNLCSYRTSLSSNLNTHLKDEHDIPRPYACPQCPFRASSASTLYGHMRHKHNSTQQFTCDMCNYKTTQKSCLASHVRSRHQDVRPYKCPHCSHTCKMKSNLRQHLRNIHSNERPFACDSCGFRFKQKNDLLVHLQTVHLKIKKFACTQCPYTTGRRSNLNLHERTMHSTEERPKREKKYHCDSCSFKTAYSSCLYKHKKRKHKYIKKRKYGMDNRKTIEESDDNQDSEDEPKVKPRARKRRAKRKRIYNIEEESEEENETENANDNDANDQDVEDAKKGSLLELIVAAKNLEELEKINKNLQEIDSEDVYSNKGTFLELLMAAKNFEKNENSEKSDEARDGEAKKGSFLELLIAAKNLEEREKLHKNLEKIKLLHQEWEEKHRKSSGSSAAVAAVVARIPDSGGSGDEDVDDPNPVDDADVDCDSDVEAEVKRPEQQDRLRNVPVKREAV